MYVKERFAPMVLAANATGVIKAESIGGFLALTSGTITVTRADGVVIVNGLAVTAGTYTPIPFFIGIDGGTVVLAGGASGTLAI